MNQDLSYENYTPPAPEDIRVEEKKTKYQEFIEEVVNLAKSKDVEYVVATRNGQYSCNPGDSLVLKELELKAIEINGRPENLKSVE